MANKKINIKWAVGAVAIIILIAAAAVFEQKLSAPKTAAPPKAGEILASTRALYEKAPQYEVFFYLQQPRTENEADDVELLGKLREKYRLLYKRSPKNRADSDFVRLEGLIGTNQGTVAAYSPVTGRITVYHPSYAVLKIGKEDKRMTDMLKLDIKSAVDGLIALSGDKKSDTKIEDGDCPRKEPAVKNSAACHVITIVSPDRKMTAYINKADSQLETLETAFSGKKSKYVLSRRQTWLGFVSRPVSEEEIIGKPDYKKNIINKR
jgi:hypothetical protein